MVTLDMSIKNLLRIFFGVFFVMTATFMNTAYAEGDKVEDKPFFEARINWMNEPADLLSPLQQASETDVPDNIGNVTKTTRKSSFKDDRGFEKILLDKVPYGEDLSYMWDVVDGDVDIATVQGLRVDRRNKGLSYTTNKVPIVGTVDGMEFEFATGDTHEVSVESKIIPFVGKSERFKVKGSMSSDKSKVFARYTYPFD